MKEKEVLAQIIKLCQFLNINQSSATIVALARMANNGIENPKNVYKTQEMFLGYVSDIGNLQRILNSSKEVKKAFFKLCELIFNLNPNFMVEQYVAYLLLYGKNKETNAQSLFVELLQQNTDILTKTKNRLTSSQIASLAKAHPVSSHYWEKIWFLMKSSNGSDTLEKLTAKDVKLILKSNPESAILRSFIENKAFLKKHPKVRGSLIGNFKQIIELYKFNSPKVLKFLKKEKLFQYLSGAELVNLIKESPGIAPHIFSNAAPWRWLNKGYLCNLFTKKDIDELYSFAKTQKFLLRNKIITWIKKTNHWYERTGIWNPGYSRHSIEYGWMDYINSFTHEKSTELAIAKSYGEMIKEEDTLKISEDDDFAKLICQTKEPKSLLEDLTHFLEEKKALAKKDEERLVEFLNTAIPVIIAKNLIPETSSFISNICRFLPFGALSINYNVPETVNLLSSIASIVIQSDLKDIFLPTKDDTEILDDFLKQRVLAEKNSDLLDVAIKIANVEKIETIFPNMTMALFECLAVLFKESIDKNDLSTAYKIQEACMKFNLSKASVKVLVNFLEGMVASSTTDFQSMFTRYFYICNRFIFSALRSPDTEETLRLREAVKKICNFKDLPLSLEEKEEVFSQENMLFLEIPRTFMGNENSTPKTPFQMFQKPENIGVGKNEIFETPRKSPKVWTFMGQ